VLDKQNAVEEKVGREARFDRIQMRKKLTSMVVEEKEGEKGSVLQCAASLPRHLSGSTEIFAKKIELFLLVRNQLKEYD